MNNAVAGGNKQYSFRQNSRKPLRSSTMPQAVSLRKAGVITMRKRKGDSALAHDKGCGYFCTRS